LFTDPSDKKPKVSFIKINFSRFEDMEKFEQEFEKAMKELKEFKPADQEKSDDKDAWYPMI